MTIPEQLRLALRRDAAALRPTERESILTRDNGSEIRAVVMMSFPIVAALAWTEVAPGATALFAAGVVAVLAFNAIGWLVPWQRYPRWLESIPPLMSIVALWLMASATGGFSSGFGMLMIVPMVWLALYGDPPDIVIGLAISAALVIPPLHEWLDVLPHQGSLAQRISLVMLQVTIVIGVRPIVFALREQVRTSRRATYSLRASQAALAHDLRTPLTSMCAFADLANQRLEDDELDIDVVRDYVSRIADLGWRSEATIRGVLELSRAAELLPEVDAIDVRELVTDVANHVDGVTVTVAAVPDLVVGHEPSVRRLFANLFENAALHGVGHQPGDLARVEVAGADHVGGWRFTVRDHGPGIPADESGLVFQPWRRGAGARDGGHGLGLAIVQAIVEQHGGSIAVEDAEPSGAKFIFTLARAPRIASDLDDVVARSATGVPLA